MDLNLSCALNFRSYGIVGLNVLKALHKEGINISLFPIPSVQHIEADQSEHQFIGQFIKNAYFPNFKANSLVIYHEFDMTRFVGRGPRIGWVFFEGDRLTKQAVHHLKSLDKLIVSSEWAKGVCVQEGVLPENRIFVVCPGVDTSIYYPNENKTPYSNKTIFLNVAKIELRKSFFEIIQAFDLAFDENAQVELWMANFNPFLTQEETNSWYSLIANAKLASKIKIVPWQPKSTDMANIMRAADCGVFLGKSEGYDLPATEMLATGKPIIVTDYSGHQAFAHKDNSFLIPFREAQLCYDGKWFWGDHGNWMVIGDTEIKLTAAYMQEIHKKKQSGVDLFNERGYNDIRTKFTWKHTAQAIIKAIT